MSHFEITEWTDFVRDLLAPERKSLLENHLAQGCPDCAATCALLRKTVLASAADRTFKVPADLVSAAEALFAERRTVRPSILSRIAAKLIYDNTGELQPAEARAGEAVTRQAAFDAGGYYVDLTMGGDSTYRSLVGQFASKRAPSTPPAGIPVLLLAGDSVVARTVTNEFGEFALDYKPRKNLRLCLAVEAEGTQIEVPLKEFQ